MLKKLKQHCKECKIPCTLYFTERERCLCLSELNLIRILSITFSGTNSRILTLKDTKMIQIKWYNRGNLK